MICFDDTNDTGTDFAALAHWTLDRYVGAGAAKENNALFWTPGAEGDEDGPMSVAWFALEHGDLPGALAALNEAVTLASTPIPLPKKPTQKLLRAVDERAELLKACEVARVLVRIALAATSTAN